METIDIVIRIPKYVFEDTQRFQEAIAEYVRNGIVLPKGHGRMIDEAEILKFLRCPKYENCDWKNCSDCNESRCINFNNVNGLASMIEADKDDE